MELAFSIQSRFQRQLQRERVNPADRCWHIGRAFDNEVVLLDPEVDPRHLTIEQQDDGSYWARDQGSVNGTRVNGHPLPPEGGPVQSGDRLEIGTSRLQVFDRAHAVLPAIPHTASRQWGRQLGSGGWILLATLFGLCLNLIFHYFGFAREYTLQATIREAFNYGLQVLGWTLFWGVITRLLRGEFHFGAHWTVGAVFLGLTPLLNELVSVVAFNAQSVAIEGVADALISMLSLMLALFVTLSLATHLNTRRRWLFAAFPGLLLLLSSYLIPMLSDEENVRRPEVVSLSRPPLFHLSADVSSATFVAAQDELFEQTTRLAAADQDN
ncbi:MAG: FHA domain-containing protein [Pseudomonadota bacterium]